MKTVQFLVKGMSCANCALSIEKFLSEQQSIEYARVNFSAETLNVSFNEQTANIADFVQAVKDIGYDIQPVSAVNKGEEAERAYRTAFNRLLFFTLLSGLLTLPLLLAMFGMFFPIPFLSILHNPWLQLALATPVQYICGFRYYRNTLRDIRSRTLGMDVLVSLGTTSAYMFSVYNAFFRSYPAGVQPELYFEAAAVIITLVLLGNLLQSTATRKTRGAVRKLLELQPKTACVISKDKEQYVPAAALVPGDVVLVRPGEGIPADSVILEGETSIDESMITGESIPVNKAPGAQVIGGSVNGNGAFKAQVVHVGADTVLAQIARIVEEAQSVKAPLQRFADKVASIFVPTTITIALITVLIWAFCGNVQQGILSAVSVLVISCPCALGLAAPTAIMVGIGVGAKQGILIRNGESLERISQVNTVVFDKTGTLTVGKPQVVEYVLQKGLLNEKETLLLAGIAEKHSEHPFGKAIYSYVMQAIEQNIPDPGQFIAVGGKGVSAVYKKQTIHLGTRLFLGEEGIKASSESEEERFRDRGCTTIFLAINRKPAGYFVLADSVRPESKEVLAELRKQNFRTIIISGDNQRTVRSIAADLLVGDYRSDVLPQDKSRIVEELKSQGNIIAVAGDGINDAPALSVADVGIALAGGSDISIETADIILLGNNLRMIPLSFILSRKTNTKIKQNFFWALFYNILAIPVAALGLLSPLIAAAAMSLSSLSVIMNSLSLRRLFVAKLHKQSIEQR